MQHTPSAVRSHRRPRWAAVGLVLVTLLCSATTWASAQPVQSVPPQLSISVDNGHESTDQGDRLTYTVTVANLGTKKIKDLVVVQSVPVGSTFVSADADGQHAKAGVTWELDLKPAKQAVLHTSLKVAKTPDTLLRLATVVCAQVTSNGHPVVCASDSDLLPAGAAAEIRAAQVDPVTWGEAVTERRWWFGGAGLAVVAAVGAVLLVRYRRGVDAPRAARR